MSNLKLLRTILRLKSLKITHFRFLHREKELHLAVKPYKNGCRCPDCGRRGRIVHQTTEPRRWEDIALMDLRIVLWYAPKEIQCPTHGRVQEEIPWAPAYARVTYRLEWRLCTLCQIMTQKAAAPRDPANADLDPVQSAAPGHHAGAPLRTHLVHILAFVDRPLTNAVGEGLNRIVKIVKNRASGYRHLDSFADMIYLTVGDLDIPAQIPSQLRTL